MRAATRFNWKRTGLSGSILAALALGTSEPSFASNQPMSCRGDRDMCVTVVAGERELTSMMTSGDVGIIARLFAEDAVWSLGNGARWTKSEAIAALRKAPKMIGSQLLQVDVRQFGTTAIVLWREGWRDPSSGRDEQSFGTDTWILRAGRWQIVASQEVHVPAKVE